MKRSAIILTLAAILLLTGCSSFIRSLENPSAISYEDERKLGSQIVKQVEKEMKVLNDASSTAYIHKLGSGLTAHASKPYPFPFTFRIINDKNLNAFALPGGYVYVNSGLIEKIDNEAQLASVIAHEIGHVTYRHAAARISAIQNYNLLTTVGIILSGGVSEGVAQGIQIFGTGSILAYSREQEAQADAEGLGTTYRANYDVREMLNMLLKLKELEKGASDLDLIFSDHPLTDDRLAATRKAIEALPSQAHPIKNTSDFDEFKKRVIALTAPPEKPKK